eukprot:scaffold692_cov78-Phaeocystis_antarctica.AAC.2
MAMTLRPRETYNQYRRWTRGVRETTAPTINASVLRNGAPLPMSNKSSVHPGRIKALVHVQRPA